MMTSSNGNISRVTGHLTRSFGVFFDLRLNKRLSKQSWGWWFDTLSCPLWCHCNAYAGAFVSELDHHGIKVIACSLFHTKSLPKQVFTYHWSGPSKQTLNWKYRLQKTGSFCSGISLSLCNIMHFIPSTETISFCDSVQTEFAIWLCFMDPGGRLNIKISSCQYRDPHVKDKTTVFSLTLDPIRGKDGLYIETVPWMHV